MEIIKIRCPHLSGFAQDPSLAAQPRRGKQVPMKRPGQPMELATTYVRLADPMSSYVSGATVPVTGGKPFI
jgi:NAD(P)-dependent dehydrogenase (short-subunit alcohol dehydrogenase family)